MLSRNAENSKVLSFDALGNAVLKEITDAKAFFSHSQIFCQMGPQNLAVSGDVTACSCWLCPLAVD